MPLKGWIILSLRLSHLCGEVKEIWGFQILKKNLFVAYLPRAESFTALILLTMTRDIYPHNFFSKPRSLIVMLLLEYLWIWLRFCRIIRIVSKIFVFQVISFKFKKWPINIFKPLHEIVLDHESEAQFNKNHEKKLFQNFHETVSLTFEI